MKRREIIPYIFVLVGLISIVLAYQTVLEASTVIIPSWTLAIGYLIVLFVFAVGLGYFVSWLTDGRIHKATAASVIISIACFSFYFKEHRPTYEIVVQNNYSGRVMLFYSTQKENHLLLNKYGIGYLNKKTYQKGFVPKVIRNGEDITHEVKNSIVGSVEELRYIGFDLSENPIDTLTDVRQLLRLKAIDVSYFK